MTMKPITERDGYNFGDTVECKRLSKAEARKQLHRRYRRQLEEDTKQELNTKDE